MLTKVHARTHIRYKSVAQKHVASACFDFLNFFGREITRHGIRNNFFLHLVNLRDFKLVDPDTITRLMREYDTRF